MSSIPRYVVAVPKKERKPLDLSTLATAINSLVPFCELNNKLSAGGLDKDQKEDAFNEFTAAIGIDVRVPADATEHVLAELKHRNPAMVNAASTVQRLFEKTQKLDEYLLSKCDTPQADQVLVGRSAERDYIALRSFEVFFDSREKAKGDKAKLEQAFHDLCATLSYSNLKEDFVLAQYGRFEQSVEENFGMHAFALIDIIEPTLLELNRFCTKDMEPVVREATVAAELAKQNLTREQLFEQSADEDFESVHQRVEFLSRAVSGFTIQLNEAKDPATAQRLYADLQRARAELEQLKKSYNIAAEHELAGTQPKQQQKQSGPTEKEKAALAFEALQKELAAYQINQPLWDEADRYDYSINGYLSTHKAADGHNLLHADLEKLSDDPAAAGIAGKERDAALVKLSARLNEIKAMPVPDMAKWFADNEVRLKAMLTEQSHLRKTIAYYKILADVVEKRTKKEKAAEEKAKASNADQLKERADFEQMKAWLSKWSMDTTSWQHLNEMQSKVEAFAKSTGQTLEAIGEKSVTPARVAAARKEMDEATGRFNTMFKKYIDLASKLDQAWATSNQIQLETALKQEELLQQTFNYYSLLSAVVDVAVQERAIKEQQIEEAASKLEGIEQSIKDHRTRLDALKKENEAQEKTLERAKELLAVSEAEVSTGLKEIDDFMETEIAAKLSSTREKIKELAKASDGTSQDVALKDAEIAAQKVQTGGEGVETLEAEIKGISDAIKQLKGTRAQGPRESAQKQLADAQSRLKIAKAVAANEQEAAALKKRQREIDDEVTKQQDLVAKMAAHNLKRKSPNLSTEGMAGSYRAETMSLFNLVASEEPKSLLEKKQSGLQAQIRQKGESAKLVAEIEAKLAAMKKERITLEKEAEEQEKSANLLRTDLDAKTAALLRVGFGPKT